MSLENSKVVDAIGIEKATMIVVLTIADSWDWDDKEQHLEALRLKINSYVDFIESGQIFETYPAAKGTKTFLIDVISRFPMPECGTVFLDLARGDCARFGVELRNTYYPG